MVIGKNIPHDSARGHVSGQSLYVDDISPSRDELVVDFVHWLTKSPAGAGSLRNPILILISFLAIR